MRRRSAILLAPGLLLVATAVVLGVRSNARGGSNLDFARTAFDSDRAPDVDSPTRHIVVEKEWPREIELSSSQPVRLSLILDGDASLPVPAPTPGERSDLAVDTHAVKAASARLVGANFTVGDVTAQRQVAEGRTRLDWEWNVAPLQAGPQVVSLRVDLELVDLEGGGVTEPGWTDRLQIDVEGDSGSFLSAFPVMSLVTALIGSGLSVPFFYTLWKDRSKPGSRGKA